MNIVVPTTTTTKIFVTLMGRVDPMTWETCSDNGGFIKQILKCFNNGEVSSRTGAVGPSAGGSCSNNEGSCSNDGGSCPVTGGSFSKNKGRCSNDGGLVQQPRKNSKKLNIMFGGTLDWVHWSAPKKIAIDC